MSKYRITLILLIVILSVCPARGADEDQAYAGLPRVILITISGIRNEDTIDDPTRQYIPFFSKEVLKKGSLYSSLVDLNYQFHMPAVSAIRTGRIYSYSSDPKEHKVPTIFQYLRKQHNLPAGRVWTIGDWVIEQSAYATEELSSETFPCVVASLDFAMSEETRVLLAPYLNDQEKQFVEEYGAMGESWPQWDSVGELQFRFFKKVLKEIKPVFIHYLMNDVESAHYDTRGRYFLAIKRVDERIKEIWDLIHEEPFYKGKTYLIISSDHPRDEYYMDHNEGLFEDADPAWLYIYGPDIKSGDTFSREIYNVDIFATLSQIYKLKIHKNYGKVLYDAFF